MQFNDYCIRVFRHREERFQNTTVRERDRFAGGLVMISGGFSWDHRTPLFHVIGTRFLGQLFSLLWLLLDLVPHTLIIMLGLIGPVWFMTSSDITRIQLPAYSPELALMEHLWGVLGRRLRANHPPLVNLQQLVATLTTLWDSVQRLCPFQESSYTLLKHFLWLYKITLLVLKAISSLLFTYVVVIWWILLKS